MYVDRIGQALPQNFRPCETILHNIRSWSTDSKSDVSNRKYRYKTPNIVNRSLDKHIRNISLDFPVYPPVDHLPIYPPVRRDLWPPVYYLPTCKTPHVATCLPIYPPVRRHLWPPVWGLSALPATWPADNTALWAMTSSCQRSSWGQWAGPVMTSPRWRRWRGGSASWEVCVTWCV